MRDDFKNNCSRRIDALRRNMHAWAFFIQPVHLFVIDFYIEGRIFIGNLVHVTRH